MLETELKYEEQKQAFEEFQDKMSTKLADSRKDCEIMEQQLLRSKKETFDYKVKYDALYKKFVDLENQNDKMNE